MIINSTSKIYQTYMSGSVNSKSRVSRAEEKRDSFAVSSQAKDFQKIRAAMMAAPDVRQDKISEIKEKYDSGHYRVNAEDIASSILDA